MDQSYGTKSPLKLVRHPCIFHSRFVAFDFFLIFLYRQRELAPDFNPQHGAILTCRRRVVLGRTQMWDPPLFITYRDLGGHGCAFWL